MQITTRAQVVPSASAEQVFEAILKSRGYKTKSEQEKFLHPARPSLTTLLQATGIKEAKLKTLKSLIDSHIKAGHDICVFGDYDADGITATAILWQALVYYAKDKNTRVLPFLPDRHRHGYGLSTKAVEEIISGTAFATTKYPNFSPKLIITVDNGIVAHPAVDLLQQEEIDVVVTDHHEQAETLPRANTIIHTTSTSGAGIAWLVALYLLEENDFAQNLIDLATIGIVADMIPLTAFNRAIVVTGLRALAITTRPGLRALYQGANIGQEGITTYDINYVIAPRINAAGRLYDPYDALRLLCATSTTSAVPLAHKIDAHNQERQLITEKALIKAGKESFSHKVVVVIGDYHEGIIGLVAGKLTEQFHKPVLVISQKKDMVKASARSIPGVNITELLRSLRTPYLSLGGHAAAAGFSLTTDNLNPFLEELYSLADQVILDELLEKKHYADLELAPNQVSLTLAELLTTMEPFGMGNPKPKFVFHNLTVLEDRELGKDGKHHKLFIESGAKAVELLMFNTKEKHPVKKITSLIAAIDINIWQDKKSVQLIGSHVEI